MKISLTKIARSICKITTVAAISSFVFMNASQAATYFPNSYGDGFGLMPCPHWYVSGNIGLSHAFDQPFSGSGDTVDHTGTGWSVDTGYQFLHLYGAMLGAELGYTHYADSREYRGSPSVLVGRTEHQAYDLAATLQLPIVCNLSAIGKLGAAYSYAIKNAYPVNVSASGNDTNVYYGGGLMYNVTKAAAVVAQWNRARGDNRTGSTDLYSLGIRINLA